MRYKLHSLFIFFFLILSTLTLSACSRGPEESQLREDLHKRLDTEFSHGLFKIHRFKRSGSAPYRDLEKDVSGILVYYDAELEFLRDYSLTSWQGLNLGTLAFVLGSTKSGIEGFQPKSNHQGDILKVYGRMSYHQVDKQWQIVADGKSQVTEMAARPTSLEGKGPGAVLQSVRELVGRQTEAQQGPRDEMIIRELRLLLARLDLQFAQLKDNLTFSTGQAPGTYYAFGSVFSNYATKHELPMHNFISEGSAENAFRVQNNLVDFALIQSDVAETIYKGWIEQRLLPNSDLRSMASLWPEAVHIVTLESTGIKKLGDLINKRIAVGNQGSGSRFNAIRIAQAAGYTREQFPEIREFGLAQSIAALEAGQVDAVFATEAIPAPALQELTGRRKDVLFLSLGKQLVTDLSDKQFAYYPLTVPAKTYPGQNQPIHTLGLAAVLITNQHLADQKVESILEMILNSTDDLARQYYRAGFISTDTMRLGVAVPLHPGAEKFYARWQQNHKQAAK